MAGVGYGAVVGVGKVVPLAITIRLPIKTAMVRMHPPGKPMDNGHSKASVAACAASA